MTGSPASAGSCAATRSTSCRTCSTCSGARCRSSVPGRRSCIRSSSTPTASAGASQVKPGLTGWAQINGRASLPWPERIELDIWYVQHRSLALDLRIIARTIEMVVTGHGLYKGETGGWQPPTA